MAQSLKILSPGMLSSLQDRGRIGFNRYGVPRSGAVDPVLLRVGNALLGNDPYEAAIEFRFMGPTITAQGGAIRVALACHSGGEVLDFATQEKQPITPFQTILLKEGDILKIFPLQSGATGYLCVESGLALTPVLGSCSTYARAGLGGQNGLPLQNGDRLAVRAAAANWDREKIIAHPPKIEDGPIRVLAGPQDDHFSEAEFKAFIGTSFKVSSDVDRMGIRLEGRRIEALPEKGYDLISDGLVCGAIQVPGSGQPIILSADCQSVGGYPKIASIISCDLYRLGQMVPGGEVTFKVVDLQTAQSLYLQKEAEIEKAIASIHPYLGEGAVDLSALYEHNLVGGVVDAQNPGHFPGHLEDM